ncbi:PLP-dependent transferase [Nadsonia fulvescens var. elongata DSM 6958]|uniref:PLP-dependent transferase n=1 Tax=Nadsonia fulvescens var. elongata DSM 6958 TaxID=857566 RepID=A0A1E3PCU9_9ASCO|nr:PLP-dependent transferase [Nadsonia fulvescens var. elongata DSM 6958]
MLLLLQQCTSAENGYTRRAFIISPTYYLINYIFNDAGFTNKLTAIKGDSHLETGIDLVTLEEQLKFYDSQEEDEETKAKFAEFEKTNQARQRKVYKYAMYLVPTYSNPRGDTYSLETRTKLVELARKYDMLIISDDVYDLLSFPANPSAIESQLPPRLVSIDRATLPQDIPADKQYGNTVSNLTFSKLLGPGLRVGWQESASPLICEQLGRAGSNRSGGTAAQLNSMVVAEMINLGVVDPVIAKLCEVYGDRARKMKQAMIQNLPVGTQIEGGEGGYFFWVTMPEGIDAHEMCAKLKQRGVIIGNGSNMEVDNSPMGWGDRAVRVSLSFNEAEAAVEAIERWGQVCQQMTK